MASALVIGETRTFAESILEHPNLLLQGFDDCLLSAIHPPAKAKQQKRQRVHHMSIPLLVGHDQHRFGTDDFRTFRSANNIH